MVIGDRLIRLYIHVPFCTKKCPYCHFYSTCGDRLQMARYVNAICQEIASYKSLFARSTIDSLYFGGGTPFLLGPESIARCIDACGAARAREITLEANPETCTASLLKEYRDAGINRLSIGAQSFDDTWLRILNRGHTVAQTLSTIEDAAVAGFSNISTDLMYDLPGQDLASWEKTLTTACQLPIQHISIYNLTIEPHTTWHRTKNQIEARMPNDEISTAMIEQAWDTTAAFKFEQYEISAFAKSGFESRHNCGYWQGDEFLGFGPSAFSFFNGKRFSNISNLARYCERIEHNQSAVDFNEELKPSQRLREMAAIGLRMNKGISIPALEAAWGPVDTDLSNAIDHLRSIGLIESVGKRLHLTRRGRLLYDAVAVEII